MRACSDLAALSADTTHLDLSDTTVTDDDLVHLTRLKWLRVLDLTGTRVTDAGLVHLAGLTGLLRLYLNDTRVTAAAVAELRRSLPFASIYSGS